MAQLTNRQPQRTQQPLNPAIARLFRSVDTKNMAQNYLKKGALISFSYQRWIHDAYPLVLLTDIFPGDKLRGVNMHYLTFPFIRSMLNTGGNNQIFSYAYIKGNKQLVNSFRSYKWNAIRQVRVMDVTFLLNIMGMVRSFDPSQIMAIRQMVQEQMRRETNPAAAPTEPTPMNG